MNRAGKLNKSADRRRREAGFDLSASTISKHTQPAFQSSMVSRNKIVPNEELQDFLKRLNYLYARELEEIELKSDVAKLIACGEIENTQIWVPVRSVTKHPISSSPALPGIYDNKQSVPRYVPPRTTTKCKRASPHINSTEHKQIVNLTARAISQYEKAAKKGKTPPVLCRSKSTGSSPGLVQYHGPSTHLINIAYGGRKHPKAQKKMGYTPLKQPGKIKKIPVRFERPISAPPKFHAGSAGRRNRKSNSEQMGKNKTSNIQESSSDEWYYGRFHSSHDLKSVFSLISESHGTPRDS